MYRMEQFIQIASKKEEKELADQIIEEINLISIEQQLTKKELISEGKLGTLAELNREVNELKEKNENRNNSIKGYERLLSSGTITPKQYIQYQQTAASYKRDQEKIRGLESQIQLLLNIKRYIKL